MSTFRRFDSLLDGKTSAELAREAALREREPAQEEERGHRHAPDPPGAGKSSRGRDAEEGLPPTAARIGRLATVFRRPRLESADQRPLVPGTASATDGIYGLILALSVIAVSWYYGRPDAGRMALSVLVTAVVFWLAHIYAFVLGRDMSQAQRLTRAEVLRAARENWALVEVVIPLLLVLGLGGIDVIGNTAAIVAATVIAAVELAAAGGYAAARHGAGAGAVIASAAGGLTLGVIVVLLKVLAYTH